MPADIERLIRINGWAIERTKLGPCSNQFRLWMRGSRFPVAAGDLLHIKCSLERRLLFPSGTDIPSTECNYSWGCFLFRVDYDYG